LSYFVFFFLGVYRLLAQHLCRLLLLCTIFKL